MPKIIPATKCGDTYRPMVHIGIEYYCPQCNGRREAGRALALVDTGASATFVGAEILPPHVRWDDLIRINTPWGFGFAAGKVEVRAWMADLFILGRKVETRLMVTEPGLQRSGNLQNYSLSMDTLSKFVVTFAWGSNPPVFILDPIGQVTIEGDGVKPLELPEYAAEYWIPETDDRPFPSEARLIDGPPPMLSLPSGTERPTP